MTEKIFNTKATYNSNCHYKKSSNTQDITTTMTKININMHILDNDNPVSNKIYYNDTVKIEVNCTQNINNEEKTISWGNVTFYFADENAPFDKKVINKIPVPIDVNGYAAVSFIPHNNGQIYAEYYGEPYHVADEVSEYIILEPRPVNIKFQEYSPYLVNESDTIDMNVNVTDVYTNEDIDYGLVTFMNYHEWNNREEKIIGNPKYLIDGKASIRYSPIQLGTNDLFHNIELIRASYNYDNEKYGVKWKYYGTHDDFTAIAIRRNNQININIPQIQKSENTYERLKIEETGLFIAQTSDALLCQCEVTIDEDFFVSDADVSFVVTGKEKVYQNDNYEEKSFTNVYNNVDTKEQTIEGKKYTYFECLIEHLPEGFYEIYAKIKNKEVTINNETYTLPVVENDLPEGEQIQSNNRISEDTERYIKDGIYLKSNQSESFFIKIEPSPTPIALTLNNIKGVYTNKKIEKGDIELVVTGTSDDDEYVNVLKHEKCYFYIPQLKATYEGAIEEELDGRIIGRLKDPINFNYTGNYNIYGYIKAGDYIDIVDNTIIVRHCATTYSNTVPIKVIDEPQISLRLQTDSIAYPQNINYIIQKDDLNDEFIPINVYIDNEQLIGQYTLSNLNKRIIKNIPPLKPGVHTINIKIMNDDYHTVFTPLEFTVIKGDLNIELLNEEPVLTSTVTDLFFDITNKEGKNLENIDTNNFNITTEVQDISFEWGSTLDDINDKKLKLKGTGGLYTADDWTVKIEYKDNEYYNDPNKVINFKTTNVSPVCVINNQTSDCIENKVIYDRNIKYIQEENNGQIIVREEVEYSSLEQNILVITKLIKDENDYITYVNITDITGEYLINKPSDMSDIEWQQYNILEYHICPQHEVLDAFKEINNDEGIIEAFESVFPQHNCTNNEIETLYNNSKNYHFTTLFVGYDEVQDTITLDQGE